MKRAILSLSLFFVSIGIILTTPALPGPFHHARVFAEETPNPGDTVCKNLADGAGDCEACFNRGGAWTVFGCIGEEGDPKKFIQSMIQIGVGMGGGIAFLLILVSGFQTIVSAGNPEKLHAAKELMTAAISGLLLIIFSVFLLKLIGVDILHIPGFS